MAAGFLPISPSGALRSPYSSNLSADKLLDRIIHSLDGGGFPASAGVVSELNTLAADPRTIVASVADVVLHDPTLALRIVHFVNKEFFPGEHAVVTVSEAVLQLGLKALCEQCSTYVLIQKFVPSGKRSGAFYDALRKTICTAILTSKLLEAKYPASPMQVREFGLLLGTLFEVGPLLLAFHYPQVYEAAAARAKAKGIRFERGLRELIGYSSTQLSAKVSEKLSLHNIYQATFCVLTGKSLDARLTNVDLPPGELAMIVEEAGQLSALLLSPSPEKAADVPARAAALGLAPEALNSILTGLPVIFRHYCDWMQINLSALPLFMPTQNDDGRIDSGVRRLGKLAVIVEDLHRAIEGGEPLSSVITGIMEAFRDLLQFDRVFFLQLDPSRHYLKGRLFLGEDEINPQAFVKKMTLNSSERTAMSESRPVFEGTPILDGAASFTIIPVGFGDRCSGVIYADHSNRSSVQNITQRERAAISVFAELLDRALAIPA